jgi:hypothetical protein
MRVINNSATSIQVRDLIPGDHVFIDGNAVVVTLNRKSKYVGFRRVQYSNDGSIGVATQEKQLRCNDELQTSVQPINPS